MDREEIEKRLREAGERLFDGRGRRGGGISDGLPIRLSWFRGVRSNVRGTVRSLVRRVPEVMVKVSGGGRGIALIGAHVSYISKHGQREVQDQDGEKHVGKDALRDLLDEWRYAGEQIAEKSHRREAFNIVLSMPKGTEAELVLAAAKAVARDEFKGHRYAMVLHTHQQNPHVHLIVRAEHSETGKRLNPRKADLARWRTRFARRLRDLGVEALATRQAVRGEVAARKRLWQAKAKGDGRLRRGGEPVKSGERVRRSRIEAVRDWRDIARALASSADPEDQQLARQVVNMVRDMPAINNGLVRVRGAGGMQRDGRGADASRGRQDEGLPR